MAQRRIPRVSSVTLSILCFFPAIRMASEVYYCITPSNSAWSYTVPCLTIEQFSHNASQYSYSNTSLTLEFLPGNHSLSSHIFIGYIAYMKLFSQAKNVSITCTNHGCFRFTGVARVELTHLTFNGYGLKSFTKFPNKVLSVLVIFSSNLYINECIFYHLKETVILAEHSDIKIYKSKFINSSRGVLDTFQSNITDVGSCYYGNRIREGFNFVLLTDSGYLNFSLCKFHRNGPLLLCRSSTCIFHMCECTENVAKFEVVNICNSNFTLQSSSFRGNIGLSYALTVQWSNVMMKNATILHNEAHSGPVLQFKRSTLVTYDDITIAGNIPWNNSVCTLSFEDSTKSNIMGKLLFVNNLGVFSTSNSKVVIHGIAIFLNNSNSNTWLSIVSKIRDGGAISCTDGIVEFVDSVTLVDNHSRNNGGALSAIGSKIFVHKDILVAQNQAQNHGGGVYLFGSQFTCEMNCSFSNNSAKRRDGGGIHAVDSKVFLGDERVHYKSIVSLTFRNNSAVRGGGLYLEVNSELRGPRESEQRYEIVFDNNNALTEGKAIYVNDSTYLATCSQHHAQCVLQTSPPSSHSSLQDKRIKIIGSNLTKTTIFGGLLDKCFANNAFREENPMSGIEYLITVTKNREIFKIITSVPVRACFCTNETIPNCTSLSGEYAIQKGESFNVTVTAVDQVNSSVSASMFSDLTFQGSHLGIGQSNQRTPAACTNLTFSVYSLNDNNETLKIHPSGRCGNTEDEKTLSVHVTFKECSCPAGFLVDEQNKTSCECECDTRIAPYKAQCSLSRVTRNNEAQGWISYSKEIGFLYHPFCPYDFCLAPAIPVSIDLNLPNGSDAQCAFDRVGLLCGTCKPGHSLSLSSSRCLQCPKINWPWTFLIVMVKIIGGIVLVAIILMLNVTVSVGTLNGLIFYANIFAADSSLFLSFTEQNFCTVFLAWLNLDFGFDVCFFKGMDAYSKAWLNILFPSYVITVLILIVLINKYSLRFGRLIGRWNPVATLATLLLLSYTKLLRAIITALSVTIITYPTGQHKVVWLQDASVKFFGLKHFPLGLLAIVIIIVGFIYTVLLFSWQWILRLPSSRNTRLNLFMEANLAPYRAKYRYWYGLLLFIRMALYLGIATEKYHESVTIVLVIALIAASILLLRTFLGSNVYRNRFIGYLNSSFLVYWH